MDINNRNDIDAVIEEIKNADADTLKDAVKQILQKEYTMGLADGMTATRQAIAAIVRMNANGAGQINSMRAYRRTMDAIVALLNKGEGEQ